MVVHMYSMPYYTYGSTYVQYAILHLWQYICTVCHTTLMVVHMYSMPYYTYGSTYVQYAILHLWQYICTVCHTTLMVVHMYSMPYYTYGSTYVQYAILHLWEYICTVCHTTLMVVQLTLSSQGLQRLYNDNNNTHIAAIAPPPLTTHPQSWAEWSCLHLDLNALTALVYIYIYQRNGAVMRIYVVLIHFLN